MLAGDHPLVISSRKRGIKQRPERQRGREVSFAECGCRILSRPGARLGKSLVEMHGGTIEAHSEAGFAIHITKPVDMDRLLAATETAIPRQS